MLLLHTAFRVGFSILHALVHFQQRFHRQQDFVRFLIFQRPGCARLRLSDHYAQPQIPRHPIDDFG